MSQAYNIIQAWASRISAARGRPLNINTDSAPHIRFADRGVWSSDGDLLVVLDGTSIQFNARYWIEESRYPDPMLSDNDSSWFGRIGDQGIALLFDPDDIWYYDGRDFDEEDHPIHHILNYIEMYYLDDLFEEDSSRSIRNTLDRAISRSRQGAMGELANAINDVEMANNHLIQSRDLYFSRKEVLDSLTSSTAETFEQESRDYLQLLEMSGTLSAEPNQLVYTIDEFEIEGVPLGPYELRLTVSTMDVRVRGLNDQNFSGSGKIHPHINAGGVCWGLSSDVQQSVIRRGNPLQLLIDTVQLLKTGYREADAYHRLNEWNSPALQARRRAGDADGWMCDFCNERHPHGEDCPHYCDECGESTVHDDDGNCTVCAEHMHHCEKHKIDWDDRMYLGCPQCADEEAAEAAAQ